MLDTRPDPVGNVRLRLVAALGLLVAVGLGLGLVLSGDDEKSVPCRHQKGATWCAAPSSTSIDPAIVRLVRGYCPRLQTLALEEVVPQPLSEAGEVYSENGELVLRTKLRGAVVESALLGQPGRLAWVLRRLPGGFPWELQIVCQDGTDQAPPLQFDGAQLRAALEADAGHGGLDLREAARGAAQEVPADSGGRVSLGTFRCRTGRPDLDLTAGSRFSCSLPLYSAQGQARYRINYVVSMKRPYLRQVS